MSPLVRIKPEIDMIYKFMLEFMHLGPLGLMKRLLNYWTNVTGFKLSTHDINRLSARMANIAKQIPCDFQRTTRSLGIISYWKATKFRFFLLYCGFLVLKDILPKEQYMHFMLFCVGSRIISCDDLISKYLHLARVYFQKGAELSARVYGENSQNLTLHSFVHLVDDIENMKYNVSQLTAFPFENEFSRYKKFVKSGYKPLHQLCYHIENELKNNEGPKVYKDDINYSKRKCNGLCLINSVNYKQFSSSGKSPENVVLLKTGEIYVIQQLYAETKGSDVIIKGQKVQIIGEAFTYPMNSSLLGIHEVKFTDDQCHTFPLTDIEKKMLRISVFELSEEDKKDYVVPFLHT
ncbi:hypothetical protein QAD02_021291 [Eretmocerus hayati]|uniref:Uncharacterized protein n=1 Tax=Eretmocerus hayati TaxID=131215 RepID=A0ACC2PR66_9HYME|nr:hypothetical protein QAD02_021291 [Eretmocerus hayati]